VRPSLCREDARPSDTASDGRPTAVDGAELLDAIVEVLERFIIMPDGAANAIALWTLHTYVFQAAMITPRLLLKSAQKRSGKTTLLVIIGAICTRPLYTANVTAAAVFRCVELAQPTLLIDEGDTFIAQDEELRGGLNAGFQKGGQAVRVVGDQHGRCLDDREVTRRLQITKPEGDRALRARSGHNPPARSAMANRIRQQSAARSLS